VVVVVLRTTVGGWTSYTTSGRAIFAMRLPRSWYADGTAAGHAGGGSAASAAVRQPGHVSCRASMCSSSFA